MELNDLIPTNCKFTLKEPMGQTISSIVSGTNIDKHGDKLSLDALKSFAEQMKSNPFMYVEHDTSKSPIGKSIKFEIKLSDGGEYYLSAETELYEKIPVNMRGCSISFTKGN